METPSVSELAGASNRRRRAARTTVTPERLPPHSTEAEYAIIGCILIAPSESLNTCQETIPAGADAFYTPECRIVYQTCLKMNDDLDAVDFITLQQKLKDTGRLDEVGGISKLNEMQDSTPSAANLSYYIDILNERFQLRKIVQACTDVVSMVYENDDVESIISQAEANIFSIQKSKYMPTLDGKAVGKRMLQDLERRFNLNGALSGLSTGIHALDLMTEGLQPGEQFIIGARPSQGKTALGLNFFAHSVFNGVPAMFISLEMSVEAIMRRLCAMRLKIGMKTMRRGSYVEQDFGNFATMSSQLAKLPIRIVDGVDGMNIREVCSRINKEVIRSGIKLVVVDYLQKIRACERQEKKTYEVAEVSGRLKAVAHDNNIAMVTLAQLNRENVKGGDKNGSRAPRLSDLADSGQIERDADTVALIHRKDNETNLIIAKQRDGELGLIKLYFEGRYGLFHQLDETEEQ